MSETVRLYSNERNAIQDSSGAPGRLNRKHFEAIERIIAAREAAVRADAWDAGYQAGLDDERRAGSRDV